MKTHTLTKHQGTEADFKSSKIESLKDWVSRQISEVVQIRRCKAEVLNSEAEWHQPALWKVRSELTRD